MDKIEELRAEGRRITARQNDMLRAAENDGMRPFTADEEREYRQLDRRLNAITDELRAARGDRDMRSVALPDSGLRSADNGWGATGTATYGPRDDALRAIESNSGILSPEAGDRITAVVERDASDAAYVAAVADPAYSRAFWKIVADPLHGHLRQTPEEVQAMQRVVAIEQKRTMSIGVDADGGFGVPFALDPTIILTSDGSVSPLREVASVRTVSTDEWKGVSSDGVTATFAAELTEVADGSPTLAQPTISVEKAQAFVEFSIEVGQDYANLADELRALFADAKANLEADKFLHGTGTNEPEGLIATAAAGSVVQTGAVGTFDIDDVYAVQEALPARFQPRASWLSSATIAHVTRRFVGGGSTEPPVFDDETRTLLLKPWREASQMDTATTTGSEVLVYGDFAAGFRIIDRIGLTIELVPHLLGANRRPVGARGLYAYWRVGSAIVNDNAIRVLRVQ